jgi:WD40 repeat protein
MTVKANSRKTNDNYALFDEILFGDDLLVHTCSYLSSEALGNFVRTCKSLQNNPEILQSFPYAYCSYTPKNEEVYRTLLKNLFPLFKLPANAGTNEYTAQMDYERLRAAHARSPMPFCKRIKKCDQPQMLHQAPNQVFSVTAPRNPANPTTFLLGPDIWKLSQDGQFFLKLSRTIDNGVDILDRESDRVVKTLVGHGRKPAYLQISPDNKIAHTAENRDEDGSALIKRWNLETAECIETFSVPDAKATIPGHESEKILWISPDGKTAITQCRNKNFLFFELETHKIRLELNGHTNSDDALTPLQVSGDQTIAITTHLFTDPLLPSNDVYKMMVWDLKKCKLLYSYDLKTIPTTMAITADGKRALIGCENGEIVLLHVETNSRKIIKAHNAKIHSLQIFDDGRDFTSAAENEVKNWRLTLYPIEHLRLLAEYCKSNQTLEQRNEEFTNLPQFAQEDINTISQRIKENLTERGLRIYSLLQLQSTKTLLQRALNEPHLAKILVSKACLRTDWLIDWNTVHSHLNQALRAKGKSIDEVLQENGLSPDRFTDVHIQAFIDAITHVIAKFKEWAQPSGEEGKKD